MLTVDQKKAHDPDRHISISANAGSGKTRVLVQRYVDLLEFHGYWPSEVVAITFTEKAAGELRQRIAAELEDRLRSEEHRERWQKLQHLRERFSHGIVTTIHGFCSKLLKEYPLETGATPSFQIVQGFEQSDLIEQAQAEAVEISLSPSHSESAKRLAAVKRIGRERFESILEILLNQREPLELLSGEGNLLGTSAEQIAEWWEEQLDVTARKIASVERIRALLSPFDSILTEKCRDDLKRGYATLEAGNGSRDRFTALHDLLCTVLTRKGEWRKNKLQEKDALLDPRLLPWQTELREFYRQVERFESCDFGRESHRALANDLLQVVEVARLALQRYDSMKQRLNALDYDDLQLMLYRAVIDPDRRESLVGKLRYFMVDEFQDTNRLQFEIVRRLVGEDDERKRLCVVGDAKQSIYGFRGAEVEVFDMATEYIVARNRRAERDDRPIRYRFDEIPSTESERLGKMSLNASFRLLPDIASYVNVVCSPLLNQPTLSGADVEYDPLVCGRTSPGKGQIDLLLRESEAAEEPDEAEMLARRLRLLFDQEEGEPLCWSAEKDDQELPRSFTFGDVAILCRRKSDFAPIESALRRHGIPVQIHQGTGFFSRQEVLDITSYLSALVDREDDIALFGLLRSPFFHLSDTELYRISRFAARRGSHVEEVSLRDRPFRDRFEVWCRQGDPSPEARNAVETLNREAELVGRIPISTHIRRLLARSGWYGITSGLDRGDQMRANMEKFVRMARRFDERGYQTLHDFLRDVREQIERDEREAEAPIDLSGNSVKLMTIHASKGLEFPAVVLPSLEKRSPSVSEPWFDRNLGLGWSWYERDQKITPAIVALMATHASERDFAEASRLLYVSMTRARDLLILSGTLKKGEAPGRSPLEGVTAPLGPLPEENGVIKVTTGPLGFLEPGNPEIRYEERTVAIRIIRALAEPPASPESLREEKSRETERRELTEAVQVTSADRSFSASQLLAYSECRTKYFLRNILGLSERVGQVATVAGAAHTTEESSLIRSLRSLLPKLDALPALDIKRNPGAVESILEETISVETLPTAAATALDRELRRVVHSLYETGILAESTSAKVQVDYAPEYHYTLGPHFVTATIDRVTRSSDGEVSFLLLKSSGKNGTSADPLKRYRLQLDLYAWLLSRTTTLRPVTGTILFVEDPSTPISLEYDDDDLAAAEMKLREVIAELATIRRVDLESLPTRTDHCPECVFYTGTSCIRVAAAEAPEQNGPDRFPAGAA